MAVVTTDHGGKSMVDAINELEDRGDREQGPGREWLGAGQYESFGGWDLRIGKVMVGQVNRKCTWKIINFSCGELVTPWCLRF